MTKEFYLKVVNPKAAEFRHLYLLDVEELRGRMVYRYKVFWPGNSRAKMKSQAKAWAKLERVKILGVEEA